MPQTLFQRRRTARRLYKWCFIKGEFDERRAQSAIQAIVNSRRRGYVSLLIEFQRLLKLDYARRTAVVESAISLSPQLESRINHELASTYKEKLTTHFVANSRLIGGLRIQLGSDVYDGSVRSRLEALERSLRIGSDAGR